MSFKAFWKKELSYDALLLVHHTPNNFYVSCWQKGTSPVPLLILRTVLFLSVLAIWIASFVTFDVHKMIWFIYLTHWGLTLLLLSTLAGVGLSTLAYFRKLPDASLGLSWHEKAYWVLFNMAVPVAFLITVFYWTVIYTSYELMEDEEANLGLDISIHGLNSAIVLIELLTVAQPSRMLHITQPLFFAAVYMFFGLIYYFAGGLNRRGEPWVYSVIYWAYPGTTLLYVLATGLLLVLLHILVVGISIGRDWLAMKLVKQHMAPSNVIHTTSDARTDTTYRFNEVDVNRTRVV